MTTMTGLLGLMDNSNGFGTYASKSITIAAGETYVYTLVNYNKANSGTDIFENWVVEGRRSDNNHCFDFRADGGYWTWKPNEDAQILSASYSGNNSTYVSPTVTEWLSAYNGVTVTLTISRSNDGNTITVAHSATVNSNPYSGTFTCTGFGTETATVIITNEDSHQIINKVVYTSASNAVTTYELKNIDLSLFDANCTYTDGTASFQLNSGKWSKLDLSNYFSGISGIITGLNLKFTENIATGGRMGFGLFGNNKSTWDNGMPETNNAVSTWGVLGNASNRVYYNDTYATTLTNGSSIAIEINMDLLNKNFTFIQNGTKLVDNQSFIDKDIVYPKYFAGHSWTNESNPTTLTAMTMEIVYEEANYTPTFTLSNGEAKHLTFHNQSNGSNNWDNWKIDVYNNSFKSSSIRADWWDDMRGSNGNFNPAYQYSTDGGYTAGSSIWDNFHTDLQNADVEFTLSYTGGSLYIIGTMKKGDDIYYVNYTKTGLSGDLDIHLYGNNATLSNINYYTTSAKTTTVQPGAVKVTIATSGYSSLGCANGLDFSSVDGLTAYVVTDITNTTVKLTSVNELPANSGVILKGTAGDTYSIPMKSDASYDGTNKLHAAVTAYDCAANEVYIMQGGEFHLVTAASTVPAGKAYLLAEDVPSGARSLEFFFDDETTGVTSIEKGQWTIDNAWYNLNGQKVLNPTKGLYIVNGKKVIIK